jgi:ketosteroid isomerase-like protein
MKQLLSLFALSLSLLVAFAADRRADASTLAEFTALYAQWDAALVKADLPTLEKLYAEDAITVDPEGVVTGKTEFLRMVRTGEYKASDTSTIELSVQMFGKTAVATCVWKATETLNGKATTGTYRYTDTWLKRSGRWQVVASHGTTIKPQK